MQLRQEGRQLGAARDRTQAELRAEARALAQRLAKSEQGAARWTGKDALRELAQQA
jgi:hypothetical protein